MSLLLLSSISGFYCPDTVAQTASRQIGDAALPEFSQRPAHIEHGDTLPIVALKPYYIYGPTKFKSKQDLRRYQRMVNDVKYCLPLAKLAATTMVETTEYMLKYIPDEKEREKHLRRMERELVKEYEPVLRKMTYSRGKVLIKLIVRECDSSPYEIIRAYLGNFAAGFWQGVAKLFTADLKVSYDPEGEDRLMEMIAIKVEQGEL